MDQVMFEGHRIVPPLNPMPAHRTTAKRLVSRLLWGLPRDEVLQEDLLYWLFYWHPSRDTKLRGRYIQGFVLRSLMRAYSLYAVMQEDGEWVDFSYKKCIDGFYGYSGEEKAARDYRRDVHQAFRGAVWPDICYWREVHEDTKPSEDAVVDHVFPDTFSNLMDYFLRAWNLWENGERESGLSFDELQLRDEGEWTAEPFYPVPLLKGTRQTLFKPVLADDEMRDMWIRFHYRNAVLRWLTPEQNGKCGNKTNPFPEIKGCGIP